MPKWNVGDGRIANSTDSKIVPKGNIVMTLFRNDFVLEKELFANNQVYEYKRYVLFKSSLVLLNAGF